MLDQKERLPRLLASENFGFYAREPKSLGFGLFIFRCLLSGLDIGLGCPSTDPGWKHGQVEVGVG